MRQEVAGVPGAAQHGVLRRRPGIAKNSVARSDARRYYVYILANRRYGVIYVGVTNDLLRRMIQHRKKVVPGFTREYGVIRLVYIEEYASITEARARERSLKRWRRAWKLALVDQLNPEWRDLTEEHFASS